MSGGGKDDMRRLTAEQFIDEMIADGMAKTGDTSLAYARALGAVQTHLSMAAANGGLVLGNVTIVPIGEQQERIAHAAAGSWELNGEPVGLLEFIKANVDGLHLDDIEEIVSLRPGATFRGGGGAAPEWEIKRCTEPDMDDPGHSGVADLWERAMLGKK